MILNTLAVVKFTCKCIARGPENWLSLKISINLAFTTLNGYLKFKIQFLVSEALLIQVCTVNLARDLIKLLIVDNCGPYFISIL